MLWRQRETGRQSKGIRGSKRSRLPNASLPESKEIIVASRPLKLPATTVPLSRFRDDDRDKVFGQIYSFTRRDFCGAVNGSDMKYELFCTFLSASSTLFVEGRFRLSTTKQ